MLKRIILSCVLLLGVHFLLSAQVTTSNMSGVVKSSAGEGLAGASVSVVHQPTGTVTNTITRTGGRFDIPNLSPGGPYTITISYVGFENSVTENVYLSLGETRQHDVTLNNKATELTGVVLSGSRRPVLESKGGAETTVGRDKLANLPTVGRNVSDYLRFVPQAKITGDGGVSLAGQNNRYNSFYIDGAVNNDVFGLAASGTNGGQAGIAPISMDAIDQFQVILSPYDASLGNFTGGGINATTRSGTNVFQGSVYHFFRNEGLSGKTPGVLKEEREKLADFSNKTTGLRIGGPI